MKYFLYLNNDIVKESLIKSRLTAQHASCLHIFRHLAQKFLDRRQPACVISIQSDGAICALDLISASLIFIRWTELRQNFVKHFRNKLVVSGIGI